MSPTESGVAVGEIMLDAFVPIFDMFNVGNAVAVLSGIAGVGVGLVFMWWGLRKAVSALMSAFRKGKVSL